MKELVVLGYRPMRMKKLRGALQGGGGVVVVAHFHQPQDYAKLV